jgi:hypothetical protein
MDISQEITLIVIRSVIILLATIGMIILILAYQKKQSWFIFETIGCSGTRLHTTPPHHEN